MQWPKETNDKRTNNNLQNTTRKLIIEQQDVHIIRVLHSRSVRRIDSFEQCITTFTIIPL